MLWNTYTRKYSDSFYMCLFCAEAHWVSLLFVVLIMQRRPDDLLMQCKAEAWLNRAVRPSLIHLNKT